MELRMFGPVEVWVDERRLDVGPVKWRSVLAALAIAPRQVVTLEVLVDRVWGDDPPGNPTATLYPYITRLRRALEPVGIGIVSRSGGYLCDVPAECVDVARFREQVVRARELTGASSPDHAAVVALLDEALSAWRGLPLADLSGEWVARTREALDRERLSALVLLAENHSYVGTLADRADDLLAAAAEFPLSEPLAGYVIRALAASGRRAEALNHYASLRDQLVEQFGDEPGEELRDLHVRVLRRDPTLAEPVRPPKSSAPVVPRQLPMAARHFVGRVSELAALDELAVPDRYASTVVISAISGTAGIGKTAMAVHWAHRVSERFSDGQLYVNLRGFDPSSQPMAPADAVRGFLDGLGVRPENVPQSLDAQTALYRSLIADRRMLVVLDNARDVEQVRPLLPGGSACLTLVTSRNRLTGLVAEHGAHPIMLDLLEPTEAEQLLARQLGADRVTAEPDAVLLLMEHCARLPLALTIAAAHAAMDPTLALAKLAAELTDVRARLDALDTDDPLTTVRAVFSWSYSAQNVETRQLFRLLGLHPGPDASTSAVASLAGLDVSEASALLRELCAANLLTEHTPGRYAFHDLLRAYATDLVLADDSAADRNATTRRMLDHYLHSAFAAAILVNPQRDRITLSEAVADIVVEELADTAAALRWFGTDLSVLLAILDRAVDDRFDEHVWQLAWCLADFLDYQGHWHVRVAIQSAALDATKRLNDLPEQARAHRVFAQVFARLGRYDESEAHFQHALDLAVELGDDASQARTHYNIGWVLGLQGRHREALGHAERALTLFRAVDHRVGEAETLNAIGWCYVEFGDYQNALEHCRQALPLFEELGDVGGQAGVWDSLGYACHHLGDYEQAVSCYGRSIEFLRERGDRYYEAETLVRLGDTHHAAGDDDAARQVWQQALELFEELGHAEVEGVRGKVAGLG